MHMADEESDMEVASLLFTGNFPKLSEARVILVLQLYSWHSIASDSPARDQVSEFRIHPYHRALWLLM